MARSRAAPTHMRTCAPFPPLPGCLLVPVAPDAVRGPWRAARCSWPVARGPWTVARGPCPVAQWPLAPGPCPVASAPLSPVAARPQVSGNARRHGYEMLGIRGPRGCEDTGRSAGQCAQERLVYRPHALALRIQFVAAGLWLYRDWRAFALLATWAAICLAGFGSEPMVLAASGLL